MLVRNGRAVVGLDWRKNVDNTTGTLTIFNTDESLASQGSLNVDGEDCPGQILQPDVSPSLGCHVHSLLLYVRSKLAYY